MLSEARLNLCKQLAVVAAVEYLGEVLQKDYTEVLESFMSSRTYQLVQDAETGMWMESGGYIGDWYLQEIGVLPRPSLENTQAELSCPSNPTEKTSAFEGLE